MVLSFIVECSHLMLYSFYVFFRLPSAQNAIKIILLYPSQPEVCCLDTPGGRISRWEEGCKRWPSRRPLDS